MLPNPWGGGIYGVLNPPLKLQKNGLFTKKSLRILSKSNFPYAKMGGWMFIVNPPRTKNLAARGPRKFSHMKALRKI